MAEDDDTDRRTPWSFKMLAVAQLAYTWCVVPGLWGERHQPDVTAAVLLLLAATVVASLLGWLVLDGRGWAVLASAGTALVTAGGALAWGSVVHGLHGGELLFPMWAMAALIHAFLLVVAYVSWRAPPPR